MVTVPVFAPQSSPLLTREHESRSRGAARLKGTGFANALEALLAPLAQTADSGSLEILLQHAVHRYEQMVVETTEHTGVRKTTKSANPRRTKRSLSGFKKLCLLRKDLLGTEAVGQVTGAAESWEGLQVWAAESAGSTKGHEESVRVGRLLAKVDRQVLFAQMCMETVNLVLAGRIHEFRVESLPLLCAAADDCMTSVEDEFLSRAAKPAKPLKTAPWSEVKKKLAV